MASDAPAADEADDASQKVKAGMSEPDQETLSLYRGSLYEPYLFGVRGPGFLNEVPTVCKYLGIWECLKIRGYLILGSF